VSDSVCIWTDADNRSEIHHAVLHEAQKLQGHYNFIDQTVNSKQSVGFQLVLLISWRSPIFNVTFP
jgi:hypothetical protein